jgi:hypothetical protein
MHSFCYMNRAISKEIINKIKYRVQCRNWNTVAGGTVTGIHVFHRFEKRGIILKELSETRVYELHHIWLYETASVV